MWEEKEIAVLTILVLSLGLVAVTTALLWTRVAATPMAPPSRMVDAPSQLERDCAALLQLASDGKCLQLCLAIEGKVARCASAELDGLVLCGVPISQDPPCTEYDADGMCVKDDEVSR